MLKCGIKENRAPKDVDVIHRIEFSAKNLTSNAGLFLLLEHARRNGIFDLIDNDLGHPFPFTDGHHGAAAVSSAGIKPLDVTNDEINYFPCPLLIDFSAFRKGGHDRGIDSLKV